MLKKDHISLSSHFKMKNLSPVDKNGLRVVILALFEAEYQGLHVVSVNHQ